MKSRVVMVILLLIIMVGCVRQEPFEIGFSATLSGKNAKLGKDIRNGFMLKVKEINEQGGIKGREIVVTIRDDENNLDKVREIDQSFIDDGKLIIFGHDVSSKLVTILDTIKDEEVIVVSPTISTPDATGLNDNFYRIMTPSDRQGSVLGSYANEVGYKNTLVVFDEKNAEFGKGIIREFDCVYEGNYDAVPYSTSVLEEIEAIAERVLSKRYDNALVIGNQMDMVDLYDYIRHTSPNMGYMSTEWGLVGSDIDVIGEEIEGVIFATIESDYSREAYSNFVEAFKKEYNELPTIAAAHAYVAGMYIEEAMNEAESLDYEGLTESFRKERVIKGVLSDIPIDVFGDGMCDLEVSVIEDGKIRVIED